MARIKIGFGDYDNEDERIVAYDEEMDMQNFSESEIKDFAEDTVEDWEFIVFETVIKYPK